MTKANRNFAKKLDFKDIKFPVKLEICTKLKKKKKKKTIPLALVFLIMKISKDIQFMHPKNFVKKSMLINIRRRYYVLILHFNIFMCDHRWEKDFCSYCLEAFSTKKILKPHIKE